MNSSSEGRELNLFSSLSNFVFWYLSSLCLVVTPVNAAVPVVPGVAAAVPKTKPVDVQAFRFSIEDYEAARSLVTGQSVELSAGPEFLKLTAIFAQPLKAKRVVIESCAGEFQDGVEFMFHPGQRRAFVEGGKALAAVTIPGDQPVRALAIVFGHGTPKCLKGFQIADGKGQNFSLDAPTLEAAKLENSQLRKLFDFGFDQSAFFSNGVGSVIQFEDEQTVDKVQIWNGHQLSGSLFNKNEKVKRLSLVVDGGSPKKIELKERFGLQTVDVVPPLTGKKFVFKPASNGYMTEFRFITGKGAEERVFAPFDTNFAGEQKVSKAFMDADVSEALDHELTTRNEAHNWHFRFRSDSSFFVYGYNEGENRRGQVGGLGRFEVLQVSPKKLKLKLRGIRFDTAQLWDGVLCGPPCGEPDAPTNHTIDETIVVERWPAGVFMVRNRNPLNNRSLLFTDLKSKVSSLAE